MRRCSGAGVTASAPPARRSSPLVALALVAVAVTAISSSAVLVRWADAPAVSLAFWRTAAGAALLAPLARRAGGAGRAPGGTWAPVALAGAALAVHFATWLASLERTSVAAAVTLVSTAPLFVTAHLALTGRRPSRRELAAVALAVGGVAVIAGGDARAGGQGLAGDALALLGAAAMAAYLVAGARARAGLATTTYACRAYGVAAACLLPVALLADQPLVGYDAPTWAAVAGMVLGPQLAGHTVLNHLLARLGPAAVSVVLLLEPVGAATLGWLAFGEVPGWSVWLGAAAVLAGLALHVAARPPAPA